VVWRESSQQHLAWLKLMNGDNWSATGLPEVYQMTPERLEKLTSMKPAPAIAVI
jgi:hypothetical protein